MNKHQKLNTIMMFLDYLANKGIHLVEQKSFDTTQKMWNSKPTKVSDSHKTLIKVAIQLERLGLSDIELEINKHLQIVELT